MKIEHLTKFRRQSLAKKQVLKSYSAARDFVFVCRPDASPGRAYPALTPGGLASAVQRHVIGKNDMACLTYADSVFDLGTSVAQGVEFIEKRLRRQHDTVANVATHTWMHDSGRNKVQYRLGVADHESMSGVVSALKAHHALRMPGQPVDDLAFALITPLGTYDYDVACYFCQLFIPVLGAQSLPDLDQP